MDYTELITGIDAEIDQMLGIYSPRTDSQEKCTICGSSKPEQYTQRSYGELVCRRCRQWRDMVFARHWCMHRPQNCAPWYEL